MADPEHPSFFSLSARHLVAGVVDPLLRNPPPLIPRDWDGDFNNIPDLHPPSPAPNEIKVCIIGAGAAGLRIAMFLDKLGIKYDILEASDRHGGRVFTHHFSRTEHDYYDVGAMRFPCIKALKQTLNLFEELGLNKDGKVIPYIMGIPENIQLFNDVRVTVAEAMEKDDPHDDKGFIPWKCLTHVFKRGDKTFKGAAALVAEAMEPFKVELVKDFKKGWQKLMEYDNLSMRGFLHNFLLSKGYAQHPFPVIEWMERMTSSTGSYDFAFSQAVLESVEFDYPGGSGNPSSNQQKWACVEGGTEVVTDRISERISKMPDYNHRVVAIRVEYPKHQKFGRPKMFVKVQGHPKFDHEPYSHIVATTPLSCLNRMDLTKADLHYHQKEAIRSLGYGSAVKIGIKFKTRWWQRPEFKQIGGVSRTDRPIRIVVYPSYGLKDPVDSSGVLIASYVWTQDATRLGASIHGKDSVAEQHLLDIVYNNLAAMHGKTAEWYKEQTISHYAHDYCHDDYTVGAYAQFHPGQYRYLYPEMTKPAARGHLHLSGEALSAHHAWIEGALVAAWRSVYQILLKEGRKDLIDIFIDTWPCPDEIDIKKEPWQVARGVFGLTHGVEN